MNTLNDIKNGTKPDETAQQSPSPSNSPGNSPDETVESKEMPSVPANSSDQVSEEDQNTATTENIATDTPATPSQVMVPMSKDGADDNEPIPFAGQNQPPELANPDLEPTAKKPLTYSDIYKSLNPNPIPDEEQLQKEQKREKNRAIISAIGDGISALSNLYSASKGAVSVPETPTLSERNMIRYNDLVNRRLKKADEYRQGLTNSLYADKQQDYKDARDDVEDERYKDSVNYRNKQQDILQAKYDADNKLKYNNLIFNAEKYARQQKETERHNRASEGIQSNKVGIDAGRLALEGRRVDISDRNERRLEGQYGPGGSKANKVRVVNATGKLVNVDADMISKADYWNYAKNALINDGILPKYSKMSDVYNILKNPSAYNKSPKLQELHDKVGTRLFNSSSQPVSTSTARMQTAKPTTTQVTQPAAMNMKVKTNMQTINNAYKSASSQEEGLKAVANLLYKEGHTKAETTAIIKKMLL